MPTTKRYVWRDGVLSLVDDNTEKVDFHLPGLHDQSSHGRRRKHGLNLKGLSKKVSSSSKSSPGSGSGSGGSEKDSGSPDMTATLKEIERLGLNDWPKKDEAAQRVLGDHPDTRHMHAVRFNPDGSVDYAADRKQVHDRIVDKFIAGKQPPSGKKRMLFMGGGTASGKSTSLGKNPQVIPPDSVWIDPDKIKEELPEYRAMTAAKSKYNAMGTHEESSDIAKRIRNEASDKGLNVVVDGTGDSKTGKFADKIRDALDDGYDVDVFYVNYETDRAIVSAVERAEKEGRWVPVPEIRKQHKQVSVNYPLVEKIKGIKNLYLYQRMPQGDPVRVVKGTNGIISIESQELYERFLRKASE